MRSTSLKKYMTNIQKNQSTSQDDIFIKPDPTKVTGMRHGSYDKLNEKGYVPEETVIENGDIIIGKVSPIQPIGNTNKTFKDNSEAYKSHVPGVVDKVYTNIYNNEGYEMRKMRVRSERIPHIGDKFCITDQADVLTDKGWINITKITKDHKVATLVQGKFLKYVNPIDIYNFGYKGAMYKLRSQQVDIDCTIDHDLYIKKRDSNKFQRIAAMHVLGERVKHKKWAIKNDPDIENIKISNSLIVEMDDLLDFLGIFISDGYTYENKKNGSKYIEICCEKERKIKHLYRSVEKLNWKIYSYKKSNSHLNNMGLGDKHRIYNNDLLTFLKPYDVGALNKYLPEFVWNLNKRQSRILLESLISGDGSHNKQGSECYYTSSKLLADDIMKLAIHAGWSGSIKTVRKAGSEYKIKEKNRIRKGKINVDSLSVRIVKSKNEPTINNEYAIKYKSQKEEFYPYEGNVYCLEVPSHVFMMRQNGKNVWIGNCSRHKLIVF